MTRIKKVKVKEIPNMEEIRKNVYWLEQDVIYYTKRSVDENFNEHRKKDFFRLAYTAERDLRKLNHTLSKLEEV